MNILGISAYLHDSAAALLCDGQVAACAQEERFSRLKGDARFPSRAAKYCLDSSRLKARDVDYVVFYDKPFTKFHRLLSTYLQFAPRGFRSFLKSMPTWLGGRLELEVELRASLGGFEGILLFCEHHESHAASAFFASPFAEACVLTLDGVGEWTTSAWGIGRNNHLELLAELRFPHSLGLLYSAFTSYLGFRVNDGEYKVMGLAPYGEPCYVQTIYDYVVDARRDGSFKLNLDYFDFHSSKGLTSSTFHKLFGGPPRGSGAAFTKRELDIACSIQALTEDLVLRMARHAHQETKLPRLCMAGGVALNAVANGRIVREGPFEDIWIQPAAGDAGSALGAALYAWYAVLRKERVSTGDDLMRGALLGPEYTDDEIEECLVRHGAVFVRLPRKELIQRAASLLAQGKIIGWFQGRMEFGPRALGSRSILADPRQEHMQALINNKIKQREGFRPFAPSVLDGDTKRYFELPCSSPYMLLTAPVQREFRHFAKGEKVSNELDGSGGPSVTRSSLPAVTHVDFSARVQTVSRRHCEMYYDLLSEWKRITGCGVLLNTSFNRSDEPIVCSPEDAYSCFVTAELDALVIGGFVVEGTAGRT